MFPRFLYPLLAYRSIAAPFLMLSAVTVPCWAVGRLYHLRRRGRRLSPRHEGVLLAFVVYLSGVAAATLTPNRSARVLAQGASQVDLRPSLASLACSSAALPAESTARAFCVRNAQGNVVLFVPLGVLLPLTWPRVRFRRGVAIAAAVSVGIEVAQYLSASWGHRTADVNDVILNTTGAILGLALVLPLRAAGARARASARDA